jgi:hypothetical protein
MKINAERRRAYGLRSRPAALGLLGLAAALLITAALFRSAKSQAPPDPAADALPRLNLIGTHAAEAAEYARQIKARYAPTDIEYLDARRRYEAAAARYEDVAAALAESVEGNSDPRNNAAIRERVRLAVEAGETFAKWSADGLRLPRRARGAGRASPKAAEVLEAAGALSLAFGQRDGRSKGRAVELTNELVKFRPWDVVPPVSAPPAGASPTPSPSPAGL